MNIYKYVYQRPDYNNTSIIVYCKRYYYYNIDRSNTLLNRSPAVFNCLWGFLFFVFFLIIEGQPDNTSCAHHRHNKHEVFSKHIAHDVREHTHIHTRIHTYARILGGIADI